LQKVVSELFLAIMSWSVEEERKRIKEAQRQGIAIARKMVSIKELKKI